MTHHPIGHIVRAASRCARLTLLAMPALAACSAVTDLERPDVVSSAVSTPRPLVASVHLSLQRAVPVTVEFWSDDTPRLRVTSPAAAEQEVPLTRLRGGRNYHYRVLDTDVAGDFTTAPVPSDLAASIGAVTGTRTVPLVMLHLYQPTGYMGYAMIDEASQAVWYWRTPDFPFGMARRPNGDFVLMDKVRGLVEVTPDGREVHLLPQDLVAREMHHDVIATPAGTLLFIAFDDRQVNGRTVRGDAIWEWSPESGATVKRWSVWDHFTFDDAPAPVGGGEWVHANALAIGPRGNILLSAHHWNQIISITPDWQLTEWRMGGINATSPVSAAEQFSGQHAAREISPGHVVMLDNGIARNGPTRAAEYQMDGNGAHMTWSFSPVPTNYATAVGSARRLANGNTLVAFGMSAGLAGSTGPTEVYEALPDGGSRWHLVVNTQVMFRAEPFTSVGSEEPSP